MTSPLNEIIEECRRLRKSLQPIAQKYAGLEDKTASRNTLYPFVLLLGNHSSGKSSFINHLLERKVQTTGVAPTDDNFTIIGPGDEDIDRNGPALVGDPDLGFSDLKTFGPVLVNHTQLKVRTGTAISDFMVVDSPGMIDSPVTAKDPLGPVGMDRGYNFEAVVRWYAERADVILLFFDPDKPGTTGETLSILTNSLVGLDHKLLIVLNKADQFKKIHDFARAYGSLCWNLSKVIQRKDLPIIYTMCLPQAYQSHRQQEKGGAARPVEEGLGGGLADLEATREDVIREVLNAPKRRVDNEISRLTDAVSLLQMHLRLVDELSKQYISAVFRSRLALGATGSTAVGALAAAVLLGLPPQVTGAVAVAAVGGTGGLYWWQRVQLLQQSSQLATEPAMNKAFQKLYARRIAERDEFTNSLWTRVQDHLMLAVTSEDIAEVGKVGQSSLEDLDRILEVEIPNLRRKSAPVFNRKI
mmetsp:Transcript_2127/g.4509  ORF Transcript_2127/g.4509 Transcript_2127/m.4509 type:complete len:471 (+) Transcript_2127:59-1471(+)